MRKWLLIIALSMGTAPTLLAQSAGLLEGRVTDEQHRPLASTTVVLVNRYAKDTAKIIDTDSSGRFFVMEIPFGQFTCTITHVGYQPITRDGIDFTPENSTNDLGDLVMVPAGKMLADITVTARSPTLRIGPDKKVFAVNQSLVSLGGTAADLLQNIPTLQVDANGNVSLRGATDLVVLVDGKRSVIGGGSIVQVLQSIPASSIDRVEIITNPSAKYDASGQAIINIVLKKNTAAGSNGSVAVTGGTRDNYNAAASFNDRNGTINWYGNYSYQHRNTYSNGYQNMTYLLTPSPAYYSDETFPSTTITDLHSAKAGLSFHGLSISGAYDAYSKVRNEWLTVNNLMANDSPALLSTRYNATTGNGNSYELTVDYTHSFRRPQRELSFDADYAHGYTNQLQLYNTDIYNIDGNAVDSTSVIKDSKVGRSRYYNIQLDYKDGPLETGLRSQISTTDNQEWDYNLDHISGKYDPDYSFINSFKSTDQVHAVYITYSRQIKTFSFQVGLRGELGRFNAHLQSFDSTGQLVTEPVTVHTQGLYPSLVLTQKLKGNRQLQLSYSRRVNRPTPGELNPFWDISDPVNYDAGNLHLLPESIHLAELTYTQGPLTTGAYFTQVNDVIKHVQTTPVNDVTMTVADNLPWAINTGLELIGNFHPVKIWDFTANVNVFERINAGDSALGITPTHGLSWNLNVTNNITLPPHLTFQVRTDYRAPELIIQDRYRPAFGVDAAAKYDFWHKKASLSLNGRDIFNSRKWRFFRVSDDLLLDFQRVTYSARASLTFTYRFGKSSAETRTIHTEQQNARIENG
ncbi:TonB-dependent receptor [Dinghuibacter silviterrae]|uniref:Outer membrane receptor protein involved in Fe transport n=1 Tax=Dinghuibacter silviterrae TaxID=1539049 RepID=A0A4R8DUD2_9BACT|nr:TonB-dependent receptor [Dinghuibacter silviterrae]TDX01528.1 outer membrane receptor protein involved in Fe transport [Dinghuibacter silviterrae]